MATTQSIADPRNPSKHGSEAQIDQVNIWMRQQPWYQALLKQWGQDPNGVALSKSQRDQLMAVARSNGIDVTKDTEIDDGGNLNPKGHKLRNTLIIAGIAGAAFGGAAALGAFGASGAGAGLGGAAATAGSGAGTGGTLAGLAGTGVGLGTTAGSTAGTTGGTVASQNLTSFGINKGLDTLASWYQTRQAAKANGQQVDMSREALEMEKYFFEQAEKYQREQDAEDRRRYDQDFEETRRVGERNYAEQQRVGERDYADLEGYRNIGSGALERLAFGAGINLPPRSPRPTAPAVGAPGAMPMQPGNTGTRVPNMPGGTLNSLGGGPTGANVSGGGMTTMRTPTGQMVMVPAAKVQEAVAQGGTVVSQGAA